MLMLQRLMLAAALLGVALGFTCVNCALGTSGSCKDSASGMCWTFLPGGSICPQPASPCDATGNVPRFVSNLDSDGFPLYPPLPSRAPIATPCPVKQSVAYFPSPFSIWRPNSEHLQTTGINSALFSHGVYFAAQINPTPPFSVYYAADREMAVVNNFLLAVRQNPCAKAIVSIATYNFDRAPNSRLVWMGVATVPAYRKAFVDSAIMFARKTGFDGIELNWNFQGYPYVASGVKKAAFATLLTDLRNAVELEANVTGLPKLLLSTAICAQPYIINDAYDIPTLVRSMDSIIVHTYNYYSSWSTETGLPSSLKDPPSQSIYFSTSTSQTVNFLVQTGVPRNKLLIAMSTAGVSWQISLDIITVNVPRYSIGVGTPTLGPGMSSPIIGDVGTITYKEVASLCTSNMSAAVYAAGNCNEQWAGVGEVFLDYSRGCSWGLWTDQWIAFESPDSAKLKTQFMWNQSLAGVGLWNIDGDDFTNSFPLLSSIYAETLIAPSPSATPSISISLSFSSSRSWSNSPSPAPMINTVFEIVGSFVLPFHTLRISLDDVKRDILLSELQQLLPAGRATNITYFSVFVADPSFSPSASFTPSRTLPASPSSTRTRSIGSSASITPSRSPVRTTVSPSGHAARRLAASKSPSITPTRAFSAEQLVTMVFGIALRAQDAEWDLLFQTSLPAFDDNLRKVISGVLGYRILQLNVTTGIKSAPVVSPVPFEFVNAPSPSSSPSVAPSKQLLDTKSPLSLPVICVIGGGGALLLVGAFVLVHYRVQRFNKAQAAAQEEEMRNRMKRMEVSHNVRLVTLQEKAAKAKSKRQKRSSSTAPTGGAAVQQAASTAVMPVIGSPTAQGYDGDGEGAPTAADSRRAAEGTQALLSPVHLDITTPRHIA